MTPPARPAELDAIVLAGGRATRLGGLQKPLLGHDGTTLLERALAAARPALRTVVVGPPELDAVVRANGVLRAREAPPFGGPVAAIAAGLDALGAARGDSVAPGRTLVLAADLVDPAPAVDRLLRELDDLDGLLAVDDDGRLQYLLAVYRTVPLRAALTRLDRVDGASVRSLVGGLRLRRVPVPSGSTSDIDSPADLPRLRGTSSGAE